MFIDGILVPVDFSTRSETALRYAVDLARVCCARVDVLHVAPEPTTSEVAAELALDRPLGLPPPQVLAGARARMARLVAATPHEGVALETDIEIGQTSETIARIAAERCHDLIVMVPGETTQEMMSKAPCPLLTCRGV